MAWTTTTLKDAIRQYVIVDTTNQTPDTTFETQLDNIIVQAEQGIVRSVQHPAFTQYANLSTTASTSTVSVATQDPLSIYSMTLTTSSQGESVLLPKQYDFIREAFSGGSATGQPRFYAWEDESTLILGPTPDTTYTIRMSYWGAPTSITVDSTTWLGDNQEDLLLYACLVEAARFWKGDPESLAAYEKRYIEALAAFKLQGEGYVPRDNARNEQHRIPRQ